VTFRELLREVAGQVGAEDARRILERATGTTGAAWVLVLDEPVPERAIGFVAGMVDRRTAGEPLQYVVGRWGFRRLDLLVDRRVLIPRPETEQVVEEALTELRGLGRPAPMAADLGTGSGAIALSLALEAGARVWATDVSEDALAVARANLAGLGGRAATRVRLEAGSWYDALPPVLRGRLQLVVANPPYVAEHEVADLDPAVARWEPRLALVPGPTGLEAIEEIVLGAPAWLDEAGVLVVETAPWQAADAVALAGAAGFSRAEVRPDLAGRPRTLVAAR
jgi:release factor glutamine methyltransferase